MLFDAEPAKPEHVGVVGELAAAVAFLLDRSIRDMEQVHAVGVPREVHQLVTELRALAHKYAASCQAIARARDSEAHPGDGGDHADDARPR